MIFLKSLVTKLLHKLQRVRWIQNMKSNKWWHRLKNKRRWKRWLRLRLVLTHHVLKVMLWYNKPKIKSEYKIDKTTQTKAGLRHLKIKLETKMRVQIKFNKTLVQINFAKIMHQYNLTKLNFPRGQINPNGKMESLRLRTLNHSNPIVYFDANILQW